MRCNENGSVMSHGQPGLRTAGTLAVAMVLLFSSGCYLEAGYMSGFQSNNATDLIADKNSGVDITGGAAVIGVPIYPVAVYSSPSSQVLLGANLNYARWSARAQLVSTMVGVHWFKNVGPEGSDDRLFHLGIAPSYNKLDLDQSLDQDGAGVNVFVGYEWAPRVIHEGPAYFVELRGHYLDFGHIAGDNLYNLGGSIMVGARWHIWSYLKKDDY